MTTGDGDDLVFGDNGRILFTAGVMTLLETTDTVAATGGDDTIDAADGNNIVFAGVGADTVSTGAGSDLVFGDNGNIINDLDGVILQALTGDPLLGGNDTIRTGDGRDLGIGGAADDYVDGGDGNDILSGDGVVVRYAAGVAYDMVSVNVLIGGYDWLIPGGGIDIVIGGFAEDTVDGNLNYDLIFGGVAGVTVQNDVVVRIQADGEDAATQALNKGYSGGSSSDSDKAVDAATVQFNSFFAAYSGNQATFVSQAIPVINLASFSDIFKLKSQPATASSAVSAPTVQESSAQAGGTPAQAGSGAAPGDASPAPAQQNVPQGAGQLPGDGAPAGAPAAPAGVPEGELPPGEQPAPGAVLSAPDTDQIARDEGDSRQPGLVGVAALGLLAAGGAQSAGMERGRRGVAHMEGRHDRSTLVFDLQQGKLVADAGNSRPARQRGLLELNGFVQQAARQQMTAARAAVQRITESWFGRAGNESPVVDSRIVDEAPLKDKHARKVIRW